MENLRNKLDEYNINTTDKLVDYFLTCYEYSFMKQSWIKNKPKDLFIEFAKSLDYVNNLERLWYGLNFKYILYLIDMYPLIFIKKTIENTLQNINYIDIDLLDIQYKTFNNLIAEEGIHGLVKRPSLLIEDETDLIFSTMKSSTKELYDFINEYKNYIAKKKMSELKILNNKITKSYVTDEIRLIEVWGLLIYSYFSNELLPQVEQLIDSELNKSKKDIGGSDNLCGVESLLNKINSNNGEYEDDFSINYIINQKEVMSVSLNFIKNVFRTNIKREILIDMVKKLSIINTEILTKILYNNI